MWLTVTRNAPLPLLLCCSSRCTCVTLREWFQNVFSSADIGPSTQSPFSTTYPCKHSNLHSKRFCVNFLKSTFPVSHVVQPKLESKRGEIDLFRTISKVLVYVFGSKRIDFRAILRNTLGTLVDSGVSGAEEEV